MKLVFIGLIFFDGCQAVKYPSVELMENGEPNPSQVLRNPMQWTAIKQRSQQLNQLSYCTLFLGLRSATVLYLTFLTSTARLCAYRSVCQLIFLISFRHFDTFGAYPSPFFFRLRVETHCDIVNLWQELCIFAQNQALSS